MPGELSGKAAIVGIGATDFSKNSGRSELRLAAEAVLDALDDAGLTPADVDGMVTFTMDSNTEVSVARATGIGELKFFWDGVNAHELRIQKRADGSLLHPPVPAIWQDKTAPIEYQVASGKGTVFSFVVHHAPKVPGRTLPFVIALVELEEGVRMLGELRNVDPAKVEVGMPVRAMYIDFPEGDSGPAWTLYAWEPDA